MSNQITVARDRLLALWRVAAVATAASVVEATWVSTDSAVGHVFKTRMPGTRNRGRMPLVEIDFSSDDNTYLNDEGGMAAIAFDVHIYTSGIQNKTREELAEAIMSAGERSMRGHAENYFENMTSQTSLVDDRPEWFLMTRTFTIELPWSADSV